MQIQSWLRILLFFAAAGTVRPADDAGWRHATEAQMLVGPERWSQLIRIENVRRDSRYPRTVYAVVFELENILWFYTDTDGTQSLSVYRGQVTADESNLGSLLVTIDRGFTQWNVVPPDRRVRPVRDEQWFRRSDDLPPNGCFVESIAAWRFLLRKGVSPANAMLLLFYPDAAGQWPGHTVLAYAQGDQMAVFDPANPGRTRLLPSAYSRDPLRIARAVSDRNPAVARVVRLRSVTARPDRTT